MRFATVIAFVVLLHCLTHVSRIAEAAQAISAAQRIALFLERETRALGSENQAESRENGHGNTEEILALANAGFYVSSSKGGTKYAEATEDLSSTGTQTFDVDEFNLSLSKGQVLAVCGPVGSGKSTMIDGIINEVPSLPGSVFAKRGKTAYVPQTPFIMNTTFRENILFGLPFEQKLYDRVIYGCCLFADIEQLGEAKDLTEIGERGVTLSGGEFSYFGVVRTL